MFDALTEARKQSLARLPDLGRKNALSLAEQLPSFLTSGPGILIARGKSLPVASKALPCQNAACALVRAGLSMRPRCQVKRVGILVDTARAAHLGRARGAGSSEMIDGDGTERRREAARLQREGGHAARCYAQCLIN